jgi:uncharacterized protein YdeI (YjbR/CyaY-like superfamily)
MPKPHVDALRAFESQRAFARWMKAHHDSHSEIFVRIYKKGSGVATVTAAEALDVALSWGWIDAVRHGHDEQSFIQRYTPRRAKSRWSQINREHVQRLIASGQMTEHGLAQVEAAKRDGRWDAAYASAKSMVVPDDLLAAIRRNPKATKTFASLSKQNLYALGYRMSRVTTAAGRKKSIRAWVDKLARGETPHSQPQR